MPIIKHKSRWKTWDPDCRDCTDEELRKRFSDLDLDDMIRLLELVGEDIARFRAKVERLKRQWARGWTLQEGKLVPKQRRGSKSNFKDSIKGIRHVYQVVCQTFENGGDHVRVGVRVGEAIADHLGIKSRSERLEIVKLVSNSEYRQRRSNASRARAVLHDAFGLKISDHRFARLLRSTST